jgi:mono/diheme cytochrome c family protein
MKLALLSFTLFICGLTMSAAGGEPAGAGREITGKEVFNHYCNYCHGSAEGPGTMQLKRTRGADKALLAERTDLAPVYIKLVVRNGLKSMPPFVPSDLTDAKLEALAAFLTSPPSTR